MGSREWVEWIPKTVAATLDQFHLLEVYISCVESTNFLDDEDITYLIPIIFIRLYLSQREMYAYGR